jgi:hypothetical protein
MKVQFNEGPESLLISACGVIAQRGESVEVPEEIGKQLIEQGWSQSGKSKPEPKPTKETN